MIEVELYTFTKYGMENLFLLKWQIWWFSANATACRELIVGIFCLVYLAAGSRRLNKIYIAYPSPYVYR